MNTLHDQSRVARGWELEGGCFFCFWCWESKNMTVSLVKPLKLESGKCCLHSSSMLTNILVTGLFFCFFFSNSTDILGKQLSWVPFLVCSKSHFSSTYSRGMSEHEEKGKKHSDFPLCVKAWQMSVDACAATRKQQVENKKDSRRQMILQMTEHDNSDWSFSWSS